MKPDTKEEYDNCVCFPLQLYTLVALRLLIKVLNRAYLGTMSLLMHTYSHSVMILALNVKEKQNLSQKLS